jgi:hypothetical protein
MPLPSTHVQESLSVAYVSAIVAKAGYLFWPQPPTEYGTDGFIQRVRKLPNGTFRGTGDSVMLQVKACVNSEMRDTEIVYDMKIDAYNKLAEWEGDTPCILILCCLPHNADQWIHHNEDRLMIKRCCYWKHITEPPSTNKDQQRIMIPRTQVFDINAVDWIFETFRKLKRVAV